MGETAGGLPWTDAQWKIVNDAVSEHFGKAGVASQVLPCYGPLGGSVESVRKEVLSRTGAEVVVNDDDTIKLFNLRVLVKLSSQQVADESLSSALLAFRRAANLLAQTQDAVVFKGWSAAVSRPLNEFVAKGSDLEGLVSVGKKVSNKDAIAHNDMDLVAAIAGAVTDLETRAQVGPFACVLGSDAFTLAHTPSDSMVMPADRIIPLLQGPLARGGQLDKGDVIVISLGGGGVDMVVATPPKAQFLQVDADAKYVFRVYVRFVLRVKDQVPEKPSPEKDRKDKEGELPATTPGVYAFTVVDKKSK